MNFKFLYPDFKEKAVTFSYDDGVIQDLSLIKIFNKYGLKATFNLNFGKSGEEKIRQDKDGKDIDCSHLDLTKYYSSYANHEIANHTYSHPRLETMSKEEQLKEYKLGKEKLESLFNKKVYGAAYPYGSYTKDTIKVQKELGIEYDRTTRSTYSFDLPHNWLMWCPTIHHRDVKLLDCLSEFYKTKQELALLYIWGHSYEFAIDHNLEMMDSVCKELVAHKEIAFMTNHEIYEYVNATSMVYYYNKDHKFHNYSDLDVYIEVENTKLVIPKQGEVDYD